MKPFNKNICNIEASSFNKDIFLKQLEYYKTRFPRFNIIFNLDSYENFDELKSYVDDLSKAGINESVCDFMIDVKKRVFSKQEYNNLIKLCDYLDSKGSVLFFKELNVLWYDYEFKNAYNKMFSTVDSLEDKILSPLEQLLYLYKQAANNIYNQEQPSEDKIISRSIIGVNNTSNIVCSGYAELLTAYCTILNNPNIKCYSTPVNLYAKKTNEYKNGHCFNIVYLNDPKYNINGYYLLDSCWDSIKTRSDNMKLSYFMLPLKDIDAYADFNLRSIPNNKFFCFFNKQNYFLTSEIDSINEMLNTQKMFDIKVEKEHFKKKIVEQYLKYSNTPTKDKVNEIITHIDQQKGQYGQIFLRNMVNKILNDSSTVDYNTIKTALYNMCMYGEKMDNISAHTYTKTVLTETKNNSYTSFDESAINCFSQTEREERKRAHAFVERQKAKRREIAAKRANNQKQQDTIYE